MKKSIIILMMAMMAIVSCKKAETFDFQLTYEEFVRAAEVPGDIASFGLLSPYDWKISYTPVDWAKVDDTKLTGKAAKSSTDWYSFNWNVERNRTNEPRVMTFTVTAGGIDHIVRYVEAAPVLPETPLDIKATEKDYKEEERAYVITVPDKYLITLETADTWLHIVDFDNEKNIIKFNADENETTEERTGTVSLLLTDKSVLGKITLTQPGKEVPEEE